MLFFVNDYGQGCIPKILEALKEANDEPHPGYGLDKYNKRAAELIAAEIGALDCEIHFLISGTLTNLSMIRHCLRPFEGIISPDTGHINIHEAGAVEATGHKIISTTSSNGKINLDIAREIMETSRQFGEHVVKPKAIYISNSTEYGTVYTREELEALHAFCKEFDLYLICDGARLGAALCSGVDYTMKDMREWCDMFTIGGTKNGALFGEAVVITNPVLKADFRYVMKQSGSLLPKGWLIGLQFIALFEEGEYYKCARWANECAMEIQDEVMELGYPVLTRSSTNQIFFTVTPVEYDYIKERIDFELWERREMGIIIRFVTSWHTTKKEVLECKQILREAKTLSTRVEEELLSEE